VVRFALNALTFGCFDLDRATEILVAELRCARFNLGGFAGERRDFALRVECLAKVTVKDKTETLNAALTHH
jgi:hypothetical protein